MESNFKYCIINASTGDSWYPKGSRRLKNSLNYHGFAGDVLTWDKWPNNDFDKSCPYNIKASAFMEAIKLGYTHILWVDCSGWAIKDPIKLLDIVNEDGYYFWRSGTNSAQTCSDNCLNYFGISRDEAEAFEDCSSGIMGVNLFNPKAKEFIEKWIESARAGVFNGSRLHDNQSKDKRFLFHRQDQSAASVIINKMKLKLHDPGIHISYYQKEVNESVIFLLRGL
jgi:hypothetical protein